MSSLEIVERGIEFTSQRLPIESQWLGSLPGAGNHALYRNFLWFLARELPSPKVMIELGTDTAVTTAHMADGKNPDDSVISVDIDVSRIHIRRHPTTFVMSDSIQFLRSYSGSRVSLFFLDTNHTYERVSAEFRLAKELLVTDGIVCVDDIHLHEGMERFWEEVQERKMDVSELHTQLGVGFGVILPL